MTYGASIEGAQSAVYVGRSLGGAKLTNQFELVITKEWKRSPDRATADEAIE